MTSINRLRVHALLGLLCKNDGTQNNNMFKSNQRHGNGDASRYIIKSANYQPSSDFMCSGISKQLMLVYIRVYVFERVCNQFVRILTNETMLYYTCIESAIYCLFLCIDKENSLYKTWKELFLNIIVFTYKYLHFLFVHLLQTNCICWYYSHQQNWFGW